MTKKPNLLIALLILVVAAPLNTKVASWMEPGMASLTWDEPTTTTPTLSAHDHTAPVAHHHAGHFSEAQDQDMGIGEVNQAEECDDHCMNCISHCFSAAIVDLTPGNSVSPENFSSAVGGSSMSRKYLLFRPPRSGIWIPGWAVAV